MNSSTNKNFTFGNLNFWRKAYLILLWLVNIPISGFLAFGALTGANDLTLGYLSIPVVISLFILWNHIAIVNRKLTQLKWLAFLNVIPFMNLIGALIMLSIIRVTKNELQQTGV